MKACAPLRGHARKGEEKRTQVNRRLRASPGRRSGKQSTLGLSLEGGSVRVQRALPAEVPNALAGTALRAIYEGCEPLLAQGLVLQTLQPCRGGSSGQLKFHLQTNEVNLQLFSPRLLALKNHQLQTLQRRFKKPKKTYLCGPVSKLRTVKCAVQFLRHGWQSGLASASVAATRACTI